MRKGSKVIKIKYEEDSIFVGAAWGRKRTRWGRKGARLTLEAISDYLKKGAGVHSEEAYLDEVKCDLLRLIRKRLYQQALKDGKEIKEYRQIEKASRSKWVGGGFGIKGAIKGAEDAKASRASHSVNQTPQKTPQEELESIAKSQEATI